MSQIDNQSSKFQKAQDLCKSFPIQLKSLQLATLDTSGQPHCSYAPFVFGENDVFYVLLSGLAEHTPNMEQNPKSAILLIEDESQASVIFARKRLSLDCIAEKLSPDSAEIEQARDLFKIRFDKMAEHLMGMPDFRFFALRPQSGRFVCGFGEAYRVLSNLTLEEHLGGEGNGHGGGQSPHGTPKN